MTKYQRIIVAMFFFGSIIYVITLKVLISSTSSPTKPVSPELRKLCSSSFARSSTFGSQETEEDASFPMIYVVTPTYIRPEMIAELTRLGQTLLLVPRIQWVVAEDSAKCSQSITKFLQKLGLPYVHISSPMPAIYRRQKNAPRGVSNRRAAMQWVKEHGLANGVLYFLDDDNAIDIRLFDEMRFTEKISMWPVGLIGTYTVSSPIVNETGKVTSFFDGWPAGRKFQVDMAGFSVNVGYLQQQKQASMPYITGHEEDGFLKSLNLQLSDIEPKASSCTEIFVWHTKTVKNPVRSVKSSSFNLVTLLNFMRYYGMIK